MLPLTCEYVKHSELAIALGGSWYVTLWTNSYFIRWTTKKSTSVQIWTCLIIIIHPPHYISDVVRDVISQWHPLSILSVWFYRTWLQRSACLISIPWTPPTPSLVKKKSLRKSGLLHQLGEYAIITHLFLKRNWIWRQTSALAQWK